MLFSIAFLVHRTGLQLNSIGMLGIIISSEPIAPSLSASWFVLPVILHCCRVHEKHRLDFGMVVTMKSSSFLVGIRITLNTLIIKSSLLMVTTQTYVQTFVSPIIPFPHDPFNQKN